jgi:hypothetical protein
MPDAPNGGLGLTGAMRLERIELTVDRTNDKVDNLGNDVRRALDEIRALSADHADLAKRVRSLELKFYGILAGLVAAVGVLIYNRGGL